MTSIQPEVTIDTGSAPSLSSPERGEEADPDEKTLLDAPHSVEEEDELGEEHHGLNRNRRRLRSVRSLRQKDVFKGTDEPAPCSKEGAAWRQTGRFEKWKKVHLMLIGPRLLIGANKKSDVREEFCCFGCSVAEKSLTNARHSFMVMNQENQTVFHTESRKDMGEWMTAIRKAATNARDEMWADQSKNAHYWFFRTFSPQTYCNICREQFGLKTSVLECEVCRLKVHRRCASKVLMDCKYHSCNRLPEVPHCGTPSASPFPLRSSNIAVSLPGSPTPAPLTRTPMLHQWVEGNLRPGSVCAFCNKSCGSVKRLQDWRCIWCNITVHDECQAKMSSACSLGLHRKDILAPMDVDISNGQCRIKVDQLWPQSCPMLAFVNSKSGNNRGVRFMRRLRQLLNPIQVFDLASGGPTPGLNMFSEVPKMKVLICGGDGTVGWVLSAIDKVNLRDRCRFGVLPLGTGNDLARVLGWGSSIGDDHLLSSLLAQMEHSSVRMLDRWSISQVENQLERVNSNPVEIRELGCPEDPSFPSSTPPEAKGIDGPLNSNGAESTTSQSTGSLSTGVCGKSHSLQKSGKGDHPLYHRSSDWELYLKKYPSESLPPARHSCLPLANSASSLQSFESGENLSPGSEKSPSYPVRDSLSVMTPVKPSCRSCLSIESQDDLGASSGHASSPGTPLSPSIGIPEHPLPEHYRDNCNHSMPSSDSGCSTNTQSGVSPPTTRTKFNLPGKGREPVSAQSSTCSCVGDCQHCGLAHENKVEREISAMNNYFGIGLDAKVSLDFHNLREEHPERCRNRVKNLIWYGVYAGREMVQRTTRSLHKRIQLECDGKTIRLPRVQGFVILNIPSYMAGANFWGTERDVDDFSAPSFEDQLLEVVAVTGSIQMANSKVLGLQSNGNRVAQCSTIRITITGTDPIPVQVDGEAWLQGPGQLVIRHKNTMPMLYRDTKGLLSRLHSWRPDKTDPSKIYRTHSLSMEEVAILQPLEGKVSFLLSVGASVPSSFTKEEKAQLNQSREQLETANKSLFATMVPAMLAVAEFLNLTRSYMQQIMKLSEKDTDPATSEQMTGLVNDLLVDLEMVERSLQPFELPMLKEECDCGSGDGHHDIEMRSVDKSLSQTKFKLKTKARAFFRRETNSASTGSATESADNE